MISPHAMLGYGIQLSRDDYQRVYSEDCSKNIPRDFTFIGNDPNDTHCNGNFLLIRESCQDSWGPGTNVNCNLYPDSLSTNPVRIGAYTEQLKSICSKIGVAFETPRWYLVAWYE